MEARREYGYGSEGKMSLAVSCRLKQLMAYNAQGEAAYGYDAEAAVAHGYDGQAGKVLTVFVSSLQRDFKVRQAL
jgi:hypothetical protein